jgi:hypothetical protein
LPKDGLAVTEWPNQDLAFSNISQGLRRAVLEMTKHAPQAASASGLAYSEQQRLLDWGVAAEIPVGESREVLAMIRRTDSTGLSSLLAKKGAGFHKSSSYTVSEEDVRSTTFRMHFPALSGRFGTDGTAVKVELKGPGIEIADSPATVWLHASADTPLISFLIRSDRVGQQTLKIRVVIDDQERVNGLMRTRFLGHGGPGGPLSASGPVIEIDDQGRTVLVLAESKVVITIARAEAAAVAW